jgi:proteic killer suppression protein
MSVVKSFRHKGLAQMFATGDARGVPPTLVRRLRERLSALHAASTAKDLDLPGYRLHRLKGDRAGRWAIDVNGPWRVTFELSEDGDAYRVDLEQYH